MTDQQSDQYMTAAQANQHASAARSMNERNYMRKETEAVLGLIATAAYAGKNNVYSAALDKVVVSRLEELGYVLKTTYDQRDGNSTVVSW